MQDQRKRPLGVTIIAILSIIGGILLFFAGIAIMIGAAFFPLIQQDISNELPPSYRIFFSQIGLWAFGGFSTGLGIAFIILAIGLLKRKSWAWTGMLVVQIIGIISDILFLFIAGYDVVSTIIGLAISGIIIYYLYRSNVKAYFGKK